MRRFAMRSLIAFRVCLCIGLLWLSACSNIHTKTPEGISITMTEGEFAAYVEHVFRHHNKVYSDLIDCLTMVDEADATSTDEELKNAEVAMLNACLPVNEIVSASTEGRDLGMRSKMRLVQAVPDCEIATRRLELMLTPSLSPHPSAKYN